MQVRKKGKTEGFCGEYSELNYKKEQKKEILDFFHANVEACKLTGNFNLEAQRYNS